MTTIIDHRERTARFPTALSALGRGLHAVGLWLVRRIEREIDRRRTMALLGHEDRMLTDLGITRGDIHRALMSATGDKPSEVLADTRRAARAARQAQVREARDAGDARG